MPGTIDKVAVIVPTLVAKFCSLILFKKKAKIGVQWLGTPLK